MAGLPPDSLLEMIVGERLRAAGLTIVTAESATAGLITKRLTDVAGSSAYVLGGVVAYAAAVKTALLGVTQATLDEHGVVSAATARQMAEGARSLLGADLAVSVTGIAGPDGGSVTKPVGLAFVAISAARGSWVRRLVGEGDRAANRAFFADAALRLVLDYLDGQL